MAAPRALRLRSARVIARRQLLETLIGPGIWIVWAASMAAGAGLVSGFAASIDPGGFNPDATGLYRAIYEVSVSAFGQAFFDGAFAEGPFVFAFCLSYGLVAVFLAAGSVSRLSLERRVGALELVCYGPADTSSNLAASLARDSVLSLVTAVLLLGLFGVLAARYNLAMGPRLAGCVLATVLVGASLSAVALFCATAAAKTGGVALFAGLLVLSGGLLVSRYLTIGGAARGIAGAAAALLQWLSPLYYWDLAMQGAVLGLLPLAALGAAYFGAGCLLAARAGARP